jgi:hypothetical protein
VDIIADADTVQVVCEGRPVAGHQRCWAAQQTIIDPAHRAAAAVLRAAHRRSPATAAATEVEHRDRTDYDRALGVAVEPGEVA